MIRLLTRRTVPRHWLVLDIVGSAFGALITIPLSVAMLGPGPISRWMPGEIALVVYVGVGLILWAAAAIARILPTFALILAWAGAMLQVGATLPPAAFDIAVFAILFAAGAWGSRRLMWVGGASALGGGIIAGIYTALLQESAFAQDERTGMRVVMVSALLVISIASLLVMSWGAGVLWRTIQHGRLSRVAQAQAEALAAAEQERVRIARDMHDVVAHSLAVVIAQADGARYAAAADPSRATEALGTIAQTSRAALSDVRMLLAQLRHRQGDGPQPGIADLEGLYAQVRAAGLDARVTVDPMPPGEPPAAVQLAVYRILQEALTNALRHGRGGVDVHLAWRADHVALAVDNMIADPRANAPMSGHGLIGMRERAQLVGGELTAEREGERFVVRARIPIGGVS